MKNKITKSLMALTLAAATMMGSTTPAFAAEMEVTGSENQSQSVGVTADIQSVYSVSLPATIKLEFGSIEDINHDIVDGYWANIRYGTAGKISNNEVVNVVPQFPCTLTLMDESGNPTETTISIYHAEDVQNGGHSSNVNYQCKTSWNKAEIGSCDYDGVSLSNCNYSYCCEQGHLIGIKSDKVEKYGNYEGNLTFQFSITKQ